MVFRVLPLISAGMKARIKFGTLKNVVIRIHAHKNNLIARADIKRSQHYNLDTCQL